VALFFKEKVMIEYVIDKVDLHSLLRAVGVLQNDEQILLVNNIDLRDYRKKQVSILVDNVKNGNIYRAPFEELTEKELENTLSHLYAFEQFLLREFMQVHQHISGGQEELKKRNSKASVNQDGIPLDIEQHLSMALQNILKQDKKNDSQDTN